jgi:DNA-binding transcriptional regulator YiaG
MGRPTSRPKTEVSLAVTQMREAQGDTMERFAARLKVALNTVNRWEN